MTYRERREAKVERLREWAAKREIKAETSLAASDQLASMIPLGQPIMVGHHSEGRHRRDLKRIQDGARKGFEHADKAREMASRADNIEAAAARAIYGDDENAAEALIARISDLEARRAAMKTANAAYRAQHKDALKAMNAYERQRALPHPPYELTNLGGNLSRQRARLAAMVTA